MKAFLDYFNPFASFWDEPAPLAENSGQAQRTINVLWGDYQSMAAAMVVWRNTSFLLLLALIVALST